MSPGLRMAHESAVRRSGDLNAGSSIMLSILPVDDDQNRPFEAPVDQRGARTGWILVPPRGRCPDDAVSRPGSGPAATARSAVGVAGPAARRPAAGRAASPARSVRAPSAGGRRRARPRPRSGASTCADISRIWVAHAVDSAMQRELPGLEPLRPAMRGDVGADDLLPPRQQAGRGRACAIHSRSRTRSSTASPSGAGSRLVRTRRRSTVCSSGAGAARRRRGMPAAGLRAVAGPGQQPAGRVARGRRRRSSAISGHGAPRRPRRPTGLPTSCAGHVAGDRGGDQHLLGRRDQLGERVTPRRRRARRTRRRGSAPARRRRCAAGRRPPAAAPARTTRTPRGWRSPSRAARRGESSRSSRCGPTRVTPRSSSASRLGGERRGQRRLEQRRGRSIRRRRRPSDDR